MGTFSIRRSRQAIGLVWLVLVVATVGLVAVSTLAGRLGHPAFVIRGASMEPSIPLGSLVVVDRADPASLVVGDVVSVQSASGTVFTHRITAIDTSGSERSFQLRGDANAAVDPQLVPAASVIGRVMFHAPILGYLLALLSLPTGTISLLTGLASLLLAYWLLEDLERLVSEPRERSAAAAPPLGITS